VLRGKKNVRLLELADWPAPSDDYDSKPCSAGCSCKQRDAVTETREQMRAMTERQPSEAQWEICCSRGRSAGACARTRS